MLALLLPACAPDLPQHPTSGAWPADRPVLGPEAGSVAGPLPGRVTTPFDEPALPRPDARVDEDYPRRAIRNPDIDLPEHVPDRDRDPLGTRDWPPDRRTLQGLDRDPFQLPHQAPIGREPCPAGMVHC